jgi:hypothetical protein
MTDTQRFLRYFTPGLTFGVVTLLLLTIVIPGWTFHLLGALFSKESALAALLATLFGSGGVGFLLSVAHHVWHWHLGSIDHSYLIRQLLAAERVVLVDAATDEMLPKNTPIDRGLAWIVLTSLWHENLMSCPKLQSVNPRASGLTDLAHSAGTGLVACIVASLITLAITCSVTRFSFELEPIIRFVAATATAIGLIILQYKNYRKVCRVTQGFIEQTFLRHVVTQATQGSHQPE